MAFCLITSGIGTETRLALRFAGQWLRGQQTFTLQTSGSTGTPKKLTFTREQMIASARATGQALGYNPGETTLLCLNAAFVGGIMVLVRGLVYGFKVVVAEPSSHPLQGLPFSFHIDHISLAPIQLAHITQMDLAQVLQQAKTVLVGGAALHPGLAAQLAQVHPCAIYQTFGMTETLSHFALRRLNGPNPEEAYTPLPGVTIGQNEDGCLWVDTPVAGHRLQTNDLVEIIGNQFRFLGRADAVINSGGIKIHPEIVEQWVSIHLTSTASALIELPDNVLGTRAELIIESQPLRADELEKLESELRRQFTPYHTPKQIHFIEQLPRLASGKVDRLTLVQMFSSLA